MSRPVRFGSGELLKMRLPRWRSRFVLLVLLISFGGLIARAGWLQIVFNDFLKEQGAKRMERTLPLRANRGSLFDRNKVVLAQSVPAQAIWFDGPRIAEITNDQIKALASLLNRDYAQLSKRLRGEKRRFVYLERQVDPEVAAQVRSLKLSGIGFLSESKRLYPQGETVAHLVGFTDIEDRGQEGIELAFDQRLTGKDGERSVIRDRLGNVIDEVRELRPATNGEDVVLSVDSDLQFVVVNQLKQAIKKHRAKAAAAIVLDAKTGEVLAMANLPTYNPNDRSGLRGASLRNRVFTDMFEPGSTLKPFTVALALELGMIRPLTKIDTGKGHLKIGPATISDTEAKGILTVEEVIEKSSNVGTSKIALELQSKDMWQFFHQLGFGQAPEVDFPGAVSGLVRPWNKWRPIEQATMSYGHGISVSLVQLAQAYTIFANDGMLVPVSLVKRDEDSLGLGRRVISEKTAQQMKRMLEMAAGPNGTAPQSQVQGFSVAGKTGTAHKQANGRYIDKYVSSFVGLAPVSDPRIIVAVMIDEPNAGQYYGGLVAAPVFSQITKNALGRLGVEPDQLDGPRNLVSVSSGVAL